VRPRMIFREVVRGSVSRTATPMALPLGIVGSLCDDAFESYTYMVVSFLQFSIQRAAL
jgi:hypothetical protein